MKVNVLLAEGGLIVIAKILCVSDLHKRYKDSTSIKGQVEATQAVQEDIIAFNKANGITHNIIMGDWYDRGFHGLGQAYGAIEMDRRLSASVNGNVYLCVGNHFYLERDENPEMYIIQPNAFIKPQTSIPLPDKPIFKMEQSLKFGTVQISFFHFNKLNKDYVAYRDPSCTFHIGIYHDDAVVPGWVREMDGYTGSVSTNYLNNVYGNIDLALHGHIHSKIGMTNIELNNGRKVPMCIPGALSITQNSDKYKHTDVQLPLIEIEDDYTVKFKLVTFKTHMDKLKFYETKKRKKIMDDLAVSDQKFTVGQAALKTLPAFLASKGYRQHQLNMIDAAVHDTLNLGTAVRILTEVNNDGC